MGSSNLGPNELLLTLFSDQSRITQLPGRTIAAIIFAGAQSPLFSAPHGPQETSELHPRDFPRDPPDIQGASDPQPRHGGGMGRMPPQTPPTIITSSGSDLEGGACANVTTRGGGRAVGFFGGFRGASGSGDFRRPREGRRERPESDARSRQSPGGGGGQGGGSGDEEGQG
eukprot:7155889-Pyramimonas_sp.AAC.1